MTRENSVRNCTLTPTQLRLTRLGALVIYVRSEKGGSKIPMHSGRVDDERGSDACVRAMVSICSIPHDLSGDNKLERLWENRLR